MTIMNSGHGGLSQGRGLGLAVILWAVSTAGWAQATPTAREAGVRTGTGDDFDATEVYIRQRAGWIEQTFLPDAWPEGLRAHWDLTAGYWSGRQDDSGFLAVGPVLTVHPGGPWRWSLGVQPTLISSHHDDGRDLGGPFQFTSHLGVAWAPPGALVLGLRAQHTSNARLYDSNPGVDIVALEAGYRF